MTKEYSIAFKAVEKAKSDLKEAKKSGNQQNIDAAQKTLQAAEDHCKKVYIATMADTDSELESNDGPTAYNVDPSDEEAADTEEVILEETDDTEEDINEGSGPHETPSHTVTGEDSGNFYCSCSIS